MEQARALTTQACSCSYPVVPVRHRHASAAGRAQLPQPSVAASRRGSCLLPQLGGGRSHSRLEADRCARRAAGAASSIWAASRDTGQHGFCFLCRRARHGATQASAGDGPTPISGYTPANYITYSDKMVQHWHSVVVHAPRSACFQFFSDWNRLVDFLDLVSQVNARGKERQPAGRSNSPIARGATTGMLDVHAQIGLDPATPDMALFQCFYRHGAARGAGRCRRANHVCVFRAAAVDAHCPTPELQSCCRSWR